MFKKLLLLVTLIPFLVTVSFVKADGDISKVEEKPQTVQIQARELDPRAIVLRDYLAKYNSPLEPHAQDFIDAADKYDMDWRLVPAISGVESTFGKFIPGGHDPETISYNGWGWGVYGDQSLGFNSWRDAIFTVTGGLKTGYIDQGLTDPYSINRKYAASPYWGKNVTFFLKDIDNFIAAHPVKVVVRNELGDETPSKLERILELKKIVESDKNKPEAKLAFAQ